MPAKPDPPLLRTPRSSIDPTFGVRPAVVPLATCVVIGVMAVMMIGLYGPMTGLYKVLLR